LPFTTIMFQNCAFELNHPNTPFSKDGQSLTKQLLASETNGNLFLPSV
jgi:hypothetical protein